MKLRRGKEDEQKADSNRETEDDVAIVGVTEEIMIVSDRQKLRKPSRLLNLIKSEGPDKPTDWGYPTLRNKRNNKGWMGRMIDRTLDSKASPTVCGGQSDIAKLMILADTASVEPSQPESSNLAAN